MNSDLVHIAEISVSYRRNYKVQYGVIRSSHDAYCVFKDIWDDNTIDYIETFWVLYLSRSHKVLGVSVISQGGTSGTVVDSKVVFGKALLVHAHSIVLAHNHPSGNLVPSNQDIKITNKLAKAAKLLDMQVLDHLILTSEGYVSLADDGNIDSS